MIHTIERRKLDIASIFGLVVSESNDLMLVQEEIDFMFDGYIVIRKKDITDLFQSDSNRHCEKLMKKEGFWKKPPKRIKDLNIENWRELLCGFVDKPLTVENENTGDFTIGPILQCDEKSMLIHHFDPCGNWGDVERIQYRRITSVKFENRYTEIHYRNLLKRKT